MLHQAGAIHGEMARAKVAGAPLQAVGGGPQAVHVAAEPRAPAPGGIGAVETDAASCGDAVNVGMKQEVLPPAVENGKETDARAEVAGIGGDGLQSGGAGGKQDFVQRRLIPQDQIVELFGDGENHVVVIDGQQFPLPAFDPLSPGPALAFRTMTVTTGVIGNPFVVALAAPLQVASQSGGAARFDGVHQLELMEGQAIFPAVLGTVGAEDAGHLKSGPGHGGLTGGGFLPHRTEGLDRFLRAQRSGPRLIERADDGGHRVRRYGDMPGGGVDPAVAEENLNGAGVGSVLEQVRRETVAERVRRHAFFNTGQAAGVPADLLYGAGLDMGSGPRAREQVILRPLDFPVLAQHFEEGLAEHGVTVLGSFAFLDVDQHPGRIDVRGFQRDGFGNAQAGAVTQHQHGAVFENSDIAEQSGYFRLAQNHRQLLGNLHANKAVVSPRHFERDGVEKLNGRYKRVDAGRRQLTLLS